MDISTTADLINEFAKAEVDILNEQDIKHPTTIGSMYEGLTAEILNRSIFRGLDLRVIKNSFIIGCKTEFDVLLVQGEGQQIPYTDRFKYKPEQVIAVIQVKKNLYSKDIEEGYENLKFLIDYFEPRDSDLYLKEIFRDSFRSICGKDPSAIPVSGLSENEEEIYHALRAEAFLPVRIIWGYNGFASEFKFRDSFEKYLEENITTDFGNARRGFGPHNFPNLIICGKYSMFKSNGMPFIGPMGADNWWPFFVSSSFNPAYFFLELIWTRLSYKFGLASDIFGEDLSMEPANRFLDCKSQEFEGKRGWNYQSIVLSDIELKSHVSLIEWHPAEIDKAQHFVITKLCSDPEIDLETSNSFGDFVTEHGYSSEEEFLGKLVATGLVYIENRKLKLLTVQCACVFLPDGRVVAGENKSGRLTNWVNKKFPTSR
jgi:hypothetical protein